MLDTPATPAAALTRARHIARAHGLHSVYTGNVHDAVGGSTPCPHCDALLIERDWYAIGRYRLRDDGLCPDCGAAIAGRFEGPAGQWGRRRLPVQLTADAP
ncbi:MAG TPA: hypothetical protein VFY12_14010, partial [Arenimonas sp.]|nr:hypothetical protein [Arenimonas sp.]